MKKRYTFKLLVLILLITGSVEKVLCVEVESIKEIAGYSISSKYGKDYFTPRFSPDGKKIVVDSDKGLVIMTSDGKNMRILTDKTIYGYGAKWSPDGTKIAFISISESDDILLQSINSTNIRQSKKHARSIWVINSDGTNLHGLTNGPNDLGLVWSPNGKKIAFYRFIKKYSICTINIDGSNLRRISPQGEDFSHPLFTPDGTKIICVKNWGGGSNSAIWMMNIDGTNLREVKKEDYFSPDEGGSIWSLNKRMLWTGSDFMDITNGKIKKAADGGLLSYDNKWIVYEEEKGIDDPEATLDSQLYIIDFYGKSKFKITDDPDMIYEAEDWSPDGKMILAMKKDNPNKPHANPRLVIIKLKY